MFDYLIVGAGFAGSVMAERLASVQGARVLIVEKRNHIGGNAYDYFNDDGILVHRYGPHIFHTNSENVFRYLSQFTEWRPYQHKVLANVEGQNVPIPINLDTVNQLFGLSLSRDEMKEWLAARAEPLDRILTAEDAVVSKVGREFYDLFFRNYTRKQWGLDPSELGAQVTARIPTRYNRDDRYFTDTYQVMPRDGYTRMFERMLAHPLISIMLNTDFEDIRRIIPHREVIYTGPIDAYFRYQFGRLPYRSLAFQFETRDAAFVQPVGTINFPNEYEYTRVTEFKHLTGQVHPKTTVVYEYPQADGDPYYPIPRSENQDLYKRYEELASAYEDVHFVGRLGTYRYYNMDQVVAQALALHSRLSDPDVLSSRREIADHAGVA
jgi:UDP-galactopyranose mutase